MATPPDGHILLPSTETPARRQVMETQMRFLFTTIPGSGHFHPLVPTARALLRRGHEVVFAASPTFAPAIEAAGFEAYPAGPVWLESLGDPIMQKILAGEFFVDLIRMAWSKGSSEQPMRRGPMRSSAAAVAQCYERGGPIQTGTLIICSFRGVAV